MSEELIIPLIGLLGTLLTLVTGWLALRQSKQAETNKKLDARLADKEKELMDMRSDHQREMEQIRVNHTSAMEQMKNYQSTTERFFEFIAAQQSGAAERDRLHIQAYNKMTATLDNLAVQSQGAQQSIVTFGAQLDVAVQQTKQTHSIVSGAHDEFELLKASIARKLTSVESQIGQAMLDLNATLGAQSEAQASHQKKFLESQGHIVSSIQDLLTLVRHLSPPVESKPEEGKEDEDVQKNDRRLDGVVVGSATRNGTGTE